MKRWLLALLLTASAFGQNSRFDYQTFTVQASGGNLLPVYAIPGSTVRFFVLPGLTPATTFISLTSSTTCPTGTPVTLQGSTTCVGSADPYGNFGAWLASGAYRAVITPKSGGPYNYDFTIGGSGGGGGGGSFGIIDAFTAQTGSSCNGIANGFTPISSKTVWAGPDYNNCTEIIGNLGQTAPQVNMGSQASFKDLRHGGENTIHSNVGPSAMFGGQDWLSNINQCSTTNLPGWTAASYFGQATCYSQRTYTYAPGYYLGFSTNPISGGTAPFGVHAFDILQNSYTAGINNGFTMSENCYTEGDCQAFQVLMRHKPFWGFPADEGTHLMRLGYADAATMNGTVTSTANGGQIVNYNATLAGESVGPGSPLIDVGSLITGTISGSTAQGDGLVLATWTGSTLPASITVTVPNAILTPLVATQGNAQQCSVQSFVITTSSLVSVGDHISFRDSQYHEVAPVVAPQGTLVGSSETISACLLFPHLSNLTAYVNGMVGTYIDFPVYTYDSNSYFQEIYGSPDSSHVIYGSQAPEHNVGYTINGSAGIFTGGLVIGVTAPATVEGLTSGAIQQVTIMPPQAPFTAGHTIIAANNISANYTITSLGVTILNPFAPVIVHDATYNGQGFASVLPPLINRDINNVPIGRYINGAVAPTFEAVSGIFSNGFVMNTPLGIGGYHGCGATVFCVDGPVSGQSETTFNWMCKGNTGACMQWQTNNHFAFINMGGVDFQGVPASITYSGTALDVQGGMQLRNFTGGHQPDLKFCDDAACTNTAQIGFALPPSDGAHPFLGVGCDHSGTSPASCTGAFAVGSPFTVSGSTVTPTADITLATPTSDLWFIGDLDSSVGGTWAGTLAFTDGTKGYTVFDVKALSGSAAQFIMASGTSLCWNSTTILGGAPDSCISRTGAADFTFGDATGAANGAIHCASGCGGGGGAVSSVSNSDGTLTVSPTTGSVVASLALGHANTWTGTQTFNNITVSGTCTGCSGSISGATSGQALIAGSATTATSSKALAGSGAGITTGPTSSTTTDIVVYTGTGGQTADSGVTIASLTGIANIQITLPTSSVGANTCTSPATATMTGLATTSTFTTAFATNPNAVTGWGATGGLTFTAWPTSNTLNWSVCNSTASPITPGAMTLNVGAR